MAMLWSLARDDEGSHLTGERVYMRVPEMDDFANWMRLRLESRQFLTPWEPEWPADDLTKSSFRRRLRHYIRDYNAALAYPFFIFRREDGAMVGGCTLSHIRRGVVQAGVLGYWMGARYANQRYMSDALRVLLPFAFNQLGLHRIEAACLPGNEPSQKLLCRIGFTREGYARQYVKINGAWQDHILYAILESDPRP
jgi:ribosomal-protein-alanine N-acetyltransferase